MKRLTIVVAATLGILFVGCAHHSRGKSEAPGSRKFDAVTNNFEAAPPYGPRSNRDGR